MGKSSLSNQSLKYFIVNCKDTQINEKEVNTKLNISSLKEQLPKNSILMMELDDHYQMFITDGEGNSKPVRYPIAKNAEEQIQKDLETSIKNVNEKFQTQMTYTYNYIMTAMVDDITKTVHTIIDDETINKINTNEENIKRNSYNIQCINEGINRISPNVFTTYSYETGHTYDPVSYFVNYSMLETTISSLQSQIGILNQSFNSQLNALISRISNLESRLTYTYTY